MSDNPSNLYKQMSLEELEKFVEANQDNEEAFSEYRSRLDWKTPPEFNSAEEEEQFIIDLITQKTGN
jgi:hypothetical protein